MNNCPERDEQDGASNFLGRSSQDRQTGMVQGLFGDAGQHAILHADLYQICTGPGTDLYQGEGGHICM